MPNVLCALESPAPSTLQMPWTGLLTLVLAVAFLVVICVLFFLNLRNKRRVRQEMEAILQESTEENASIASESLIAALSGERFVPGTDLYQNAHQSAEKFADDFVAQVETARILVDEKNKELVQQKLQRIANGRHPQMLEALCVQDSWCMQAVYKGQTPPENVVPLLQSLFRPVQVPLCSSIQLDVPPLVTGIVAAVGAFLGAMVISFCFNLCGMKQPSDSTVLIAATMGALFITWGILSITANEKRRRAIEIAIYAISAGDAGITILSILFPFGKLRGSKNLFSGNFMNRLLMYIALILLIKKLKRGLTISSPELKQKMTSLYFERIQATTLLLASYDAAKKDEAMKWEGLLQGLEGKITGLKEELSRINSYKNRMLRLYEFFVDIWNSEDERKLGLNMNNMNQEFGLLGFPRLDENSSNPYPKGSVVTWHPDMDREFRRFGLIYEGDSVFVEKAPIYDSSGNVLEKGDICLFDQTGDGKTGI